MTASLCASVMRQVRRLTFSEARKLPILEFRLPDILSAMELTMPQFVDLCILCGCDYTDTIRGIGPKKALALIKTHGTIEKVIENLDTTKYPLPDSFDFAQARELFLHPEVTDPETLECKYSEPDEEAYVWRILPLSPAVGRVHVVNGRVTCSPPPPTVLSSCQANKVFSGGEGLQPRTSRARH